MVFVVSSTDKAITVAQTINARMETGKGRLIGKVTHGLISSVERNDMPGPSEEPVSGVKLVILIMDYAKKKSLQRNSIQDRITMNSDASFRSE